MEPLSVHTCPPLEKVTATKMSESFVRIALTWDSGDFVEKLAGRLVDPLDL